MKRSLFAVSLLSLFAFACKTVEVKADVAPPNADQQELTVVEQGLQEFSLRLSAKLLGEHDVTVESAKWELVVDGAVMKSGTQPFAQTIAAGVATELVIPVQGQYVADAEALKAMDARGGSLLCAVRGAFLVRTGQNVVEVPFARSREVRVPRLPHMKLQEIEAGRYSEDEAGLSIHLGVNNQNPFEVRVQAIHYEVFIAGKKVGDGDIGRSEKVLPNSVGVFDIDAKATAETHGAPEVKKLIKSLKLPYQVKGKLEAGLFSEGFDFSGTLNLPPAK